MMKICLLLLALVVSAQSIPIVPGKAVTGDVKCDVCIQFMDQALNILLNEILNGGVIAGCADLCSHVPKGDGLEVTCNILCDVVGIKEFIKIINQTDPDPIWYCQELDSCPKVNGGSVSISSSSVSPSSGPIGTTFKIQTLYTVINATGPGLFAINIVPQDGESITDAELSYGQAPGSYDIEWDIQSDTNFTTGVYNVQIQICEGDCINKHPYSGIYAQTTTNFTITN